MWITHIEEKVCQQSVKWIVDTTTTTTRNNRTGQCIYIFTLTSENVKVTKVGVSTPHF